MTMTRRPNRWADFINSPNFPPAPPPRQWAEEVNAAIKKQIAVANERVLRGEEPFPMRRPRTEIELRQQIMAGTAYHG